jgi:hypothetical protein
MLGANLQDLSGQSKVPILFWSGWKQILPCGRQVCAEGEIITRVGGAQ